MHPNKIAHLHNTQKSRVPKPGLISGQEIMHCIADTINQHGFFYPGGETLDHLEYDSDIIIAGLHGYHEGTFEFGSRENKDITIEDIFAMAAKKIQNLAITNAMTQFAE
jgi:hypothetical protein